MKDNDIYSWRWKDDEKHSHCGDWGSYHCLSRIAVVRNGKLFDTFWHDHSKELSQEDIIVEFLGNPAKMTRISRYDIHYYKASDIVDTSHSNHTQAPVYIKNGATKSASVMLDNINHSIDEAKSNIQFETRKIKRMEEYKFKIGIGKLDEVFL